jgi:hypothetical protein
MTKHEFVEEIIEGFRERVTTSFNLSIGPEMTSALNQAYQKGFDNGMAHERYLRGDKHEKR